MQFSRRTFEARRERAQALRDAALLMAAHVGSLLYLIVACLPRPVF